MKRNLIYPAATLVFLGCKDDEPNLVNSTDVLVGEWELTEIDGQPWDTEGGTYFLTFEFEVDGDFTRCYEYASYSECYLGNWEWLNANNTIHMSQVDYSYFLDVTILNADQLVGDIYEEGQASDSYNVVFQRRN